MCVVFTFIVCRVDFSYVGWDLSYIGIQDWLKNFPGYNYQTDQNN